MFTLGFVGPEGIGEAPTGAVCRDQHDIKAHPSRAMARVGGKPGLCGGYKPCALARAKGEGGLCQGWPGLYFNEREQAFAFGDQVNFAGFGAEPLGKDLPALSAKRCGGEGFGILTGGISAPATQQAMCGWGFAWFWHETP